MGLIPNDIISAVLERCDIVTVIGRYVKLNKAGRNFKALCPFHNEKSPSFVVNPDKQIFHCFGCGAGGNTIGFVMRQEHLEFPLAVRLLAEQCGIAVPEDAQEEFSPSRELRDSIYNANELAVGYFHEHLLTGKDETVKSARDYLKGRGINLEVVRKFSIGFAPDAWDGLIKFLTEKDISLSVMEQAGLIIARENKKGFYDRFRNRIMFPIFDIQSRPVAFGARAMNEADGAKYINSPETPVYTKGRHLFGLNLTKTAAGKLEQMIVVEGYMDMIMPFIHGVENIAASLGTALTPEQIRLIRRYTSNVIMLFDTDTAGQNAIIRSLDVLVEEGMNVRVVKLADDEDPDSFIREYGIDEFRQRLSQAHSLFDFKYDWFSSQHEAATPEGKSLIRQAMLDTINRYRDDVVKFELKKKLADRINIPMDVPEQRPKGLKPVEILPEIKPAAKLDRGEEMLLALFLNDPQWVVKAKDLLTPQDFNDGLTRDIVSRLWVLSGAKEEWSVADVLVDLNDPAAVSLVTRLVSQDEKFFVDPKLAFADCTARIRHERVKSQRNELIQAIRQAEFKGDEGIVEQLRGKLNQLMKLS